MGTTLETHERSTASQGQASSHGDPNKQRLDEFGTDLLFREARSHYHWLKKPVSDETLRELYELTKFGPTSANCCPARILFLRTPEAKARLAPALNPGNVDKTMAAPVTAIIGYDIKFYEKLPKLFPFTDARSWFVNNPELIQATAFRNSSLQGGYFIMAARALGLDCGPMSGFDQEKVDHAFFRASGDGTTATQEHFPESHIHTNFICNLGYGDPSKVHPRAPRLSFEETCQLL